jgi:biopolymer transport protein ExbD
MNSLIPDEKINMNITFNITPMIDFIFIMFSFFAILALSKISVTDTSLNLVKVNSNKPTYLTHTPYQINLSISPVGKYNWITQMEVYKMETIEKIQKELLTQYQSGIIPKDKTKTQVLLHVDKQAPWDSVAKLIFAIKEVGFEANPIYQNNDGIHGTR